jgi:ubiquinol-cytochrome c reductase cytochrome b subunit
MGNRLDRWLRLNSLDFPVPVHSKNLLYTLGGIAFTGFMILFLTGIYLTQFFDPNPEGARQSIQTIMDTAVAGRFIRSLHYWTAQAVVIALGFHLLRVFITGAYKSPRTMTWYLGVGLFFTATMGSFFSGTVIKWDHEATEALHHFKSVIESLGPLGTLFSEELTGAVSLNLRMYTYHITLAPLALILLVIGHFYLIHVFNISPLPTGGSARLEEVPKEELTGTFMEHVRSILLFSLIYYGAVAVLSFVVPAPIGADPMEEMTGEKPLWPFLWMYGIENLTGMQGILYGSAALLLLLVMIPLLDRGPSRDLRDRKGILALGSAALLTMIGFTLFAWIAPPQLHEGHDHSMEESTPADHSHDEEEPPLMDEHTREEGESH